MDWVLAGVVGSAGRGRDDVCTNGSTLRSAARKIRQVNADCEIVAATAGQMIMKAVVADESVLLA